MILNNLKTNKLMKNQTAVEWLAEQMLHPQNFNPYIEKALKIEKQQQDKFAIEFAEWCIKKRVDFFDDTEIGRTYTMMEGHSRYKMKELLDLFKKEKTVQDYYNQMDNEVHFNRGNLNK